MACSKKNAPAPVSVPEPQVITVVTPAFITSKSVIVTPVNGKWEFVSSYGTAGMQTPATTNITERYEFGSDSTASIYFNNKFSSRVNYSFTKDFKYTDYRSTQTFDRVKIDAASYKATIKNDTLHLDTYDMYDPSYSIFVRIK